MVQASQFVMVCTRVIARDDGKKQLAFNGMPFFLAPMNSHLFAVFLFIGLMLCIRRLLLNDNCY